MPVCTPSGGFGAHELHDAEDEGAADDGRWYQRGQYIPSFVLAPEVGPCFQAAVFHTAPVGATWGRASGRPGRGPRMTIAPRRPQRVAGTHPHLAGEHSLMAVSPARLPDAVCKCCEKRTTSPRRSQSTESAAHRQISDHQRSRHLVVQPLLEWLVDQDEQADANRNTPASRLTAGIPIAHRAPGAGRAFRAPVRTPPATGATRIRNTASQGAPITGKRGQS